jgi:ATP-dependent RNA helicase DeaD
VLFSATIPEDIERIASRYMRSPEKVQLSAGYVGVQEITHTYYMVSGMGRTRDLVRVLEAERPDSAIIFCNTREDTSLVAEFLRKNGLDAEAISSDLTQRDRERVMQRMKDKNLHYLVATDIAARGIDISDLSHVINYTFPESAEVYVHRTGRTGRAGKSGVAISLISPRELGNFYMLKLTYKIRPEERTLPSEEQAKTLKEAAKVEELLKMIGDGDASPAARAVARRLWSSTDGERVVALLIEERLSGKGPARPAAAARPVGVAAPAAVAAAVSVPATVSVPAADRSSPSSRPEMGVSSSPSSRPSGAATPETAAPPRPGVSASPPPDSESDAPRRRRGRRGGRGRGEGSGESRSSERNGQARNGTSHAARGGRAQGRPETIDTSDGREFWEAWVDSKQTDAPSAGEPTAPIPDAPRSARGPAPARAALEPGQVRLYLNIGRRDGAREPEVEKLLGDLGLSVSSVQVLNSHTYLITEESRADALTAALTGQKYGERDLVCERARK